MKRPESLHGRPVAGSYICEQWELRITRRCLADDLNADADSDFESVMGLSIVRALVRERSDHPGGPDELSGLRSGVPLTVLRHQHHHRGATWYDDVDEVVWLAAYGRHRSGQADDFFPYARTLDEADVLLPVTADFAALIRDRDARFAAAVRVEAPLILDHARRETGEQRAIIGGDVPAAVSVEVAEDLESITIAFNVADIGWDAVPVMLVCFHPGDWQLVPRMPSRSLEPGEVAMAVDYVVPSEE